MSKTYDHLTTEELAEQIAKREEVLPKFQSESTLTRYMASILEAQKAELARRQS